MGTWQMDQKPSHLKVIIDLARSLVVHVQLFSEETTGAMGRVIKQNTSCTSEEEKTTSVPNEFEEFDATIQHARKTRKSIGTSNAKRKRIPTAKVPTQKGAVCEERRVRR